MGHCQVDLVQVPAETSAGALCSAWRSARSSTYRSSSCPATGITPGTRSIGETAYKPPIPSATLLLVGTAGSATSAAARPLAYRGSRLIPSQNRGSGDPGSSAAAFASAVNSRGGTSGGTSRSGLACAASNWVGLRVWRLLARWLTGQVIVDRHRVVLFGRVLPGSPSSRRAPPPMTGRVRHRAGIPHDQVCRLNTAILTRPRDETDTEVSSDRAEAPPNSSATGDDHHV